MEARTKQAARGLFETIRSKFQAIGVQLDFSWDKITEYGAALAVGLAAGFLVKRYGKKVIFTAVVLAAVLWALSYFDFVTIDWAKFKAVVGGTHQNTFESFFKDYLAWARERAITLFAGVIGFIIGYKFG